MMCRFTWWILFACYVNLSQCASNDRVQVLDDALRIRYDHQVKDGSSDFSQTVDTKMFKGIKPVNCSADENNFCLRWDDVAEFRIDRVDKNCENFEFQTKLNQSLSVAFDISGLYLYGGDEVDYQSWPIKTTNRTLEPFVSKESNSEAVLEPVWFTDSGFYSQVNQNVPLFVSFREKFLNFVAKQEAPYIRDRPVKLQYKVCKFGDIKLAYEDYINAVKKPIAPPDYKMVELPIWSTWAKYKSEINYTTVLEFANLIRSNGFPNSQIEIDDKWETCYGSLTIDKKRFPSMKNLVDQLKAMDFRVTLWVHPFVNVDCSPYFKEGESNNYFVKSENGTVVSKWWNGAGAYIDFTNPKAVMWMHSRLEKIRDETGISSFKFDAGESSWLPQLPVFHTMSEDHPEIMLKKYVRMAASYGTMVEVRSARQTQDLPIFVRMIDRETRWTGRLAVTTLIPELLHMNLIGYPYVLPDMIGGNGYGKDVLTAELFIRWLQINVFMPSLQFSYPPWDFGQEVVNITLKYIDLHKLYAPKIYELMKKATKEPTMVNAPLWKIDPTDSTTFTIQNEFLLDNVLVAPVVEKGATSRDIYLPKGLWRDENNKNSPPIQGPTWLRNYPAPLDVLPYYTLIGTVSASSVMSPSLLIVLFTCIFLNWYRSIF